MLAIYSTFLQQGYDQLIHDVALQGLDVTLAIDRAGLVGQDGPTHHGTFDLSYLRCIPNMVIGAPSDENSAGDAAERLAARWPAAVRYPRAKVLALRSTVSCRPSRSASKCRQRGQRVAILNFGVLLDQALAAGEALDATVVDMRWVKPLDEAVILSLVAQHQYLITLRKTPLQAAREAAWRVPDERGRQLRHPACRHPRRFHCSRRSGRVPTVGRADRRRHYCGRRRRWRDGLRTKPAGCITRGL